MADTFDPDAYLAAQTPKAEFDPDAYLKQNAAAPTVAAATAPPPAAGAFDPDSYLKENTPRPDKLSKLQMDKARNANGNLDINKLSKSLTPEQRRAGIEEMGLGPLDRAMGPTALAGMNPYATAFSAIDVGAREERNRFEREHPLKAAWAGGAQQPLVRLPSPEGSGVLSGVGRGASSILSGLTTPENVALIASMEGAPAALKTIAGAAFTAMMAKQLPDHYSAWQDAKTPGDKAQAATEFFGTAAMMGLGAKGEFGRDAGTVKRTGGLTANEADALTKKIEQHGTDLVRTISPEVEAVLPRLPGDTQDKVRAILKKQSQSQPLSDNEHATLLQVGSYASQVAQDQTPEEFTSPTASTPTSAPAAGATGGTPSDIPGGSPSGRSSLFAQAKQEAAVAPLVQSAEAASDVTPAAAEAAKQAAAVIAGKTSSPTAEVEPPASGQAETPTEAAEGQLSKEVPTATGAAGVEQTPEAKPTQEKMNPTEAHDFQEWARGKTVRELRELRDDHENDPRAKSDHAIELINKIIAEKSKSLKVTVDQPGVKPEAPSPLVGPALIQDSQIVAKGEVGKIHDDLVREGAEQDKDLTDATRGFHDENGQPLSRTEAAQRALDTGVIDKPTYDKVMAREPAENKGLHSEDLIAAQEKSIPAEPQFVLPKRAEAAEDKMVTVDIGKFDQGFSRDPQYLGKGQEDVPGRRATFEQFQKTGNPIETPEVYVSPDGKVTFINGRHRYATLRDQGRESMPVAMNEESIANAKKAGLLKPESAEAPKTDTRKFKPEAIPDVLKELEEEKPAAPAEPEKTDLTYTASKGEATGMKPLPTDPYAPVEPHAKDVVREDFDGNFIVKDKKGGYEVWRRGDTVSHKVANFGGSMLDRATERLAELTEASYQREVNRRGEKPLPPEPLPETNPSPIDKDEAATATRGIPGALGDAVRDVLLNDKSVEEAAADNGTTSAKVQDSVNRMRQYLSDKAAKATADELKGESTPLDDETVNGYVESQSERPLEETVRFLVENKVPDSQILKAIQKGGNPNFGKPELAKFKRSLGVEDGTPEKSAEPAAPKKTWQRTRDEVAQAGDSLAAHRLAVRKAIGEGQAVPLEVLEDFKGSPWADKAREQMYGQQISDTLLGKILKGLTDEGNTLYSDPLFINSVGKPVLRAAVKILQEGIEGGKLAEDAITDALGYLREHIPNLNEDKANEFFDQFFEKPDETTPQSQPETPGVETPGEPREQLPPGEEAPPAPRTEDAAVDPRATTEEGQRYTSNKNTVVDAERKARGDPELMSEAAKSLGATWDEASRQVDLNREAGPNLVKELNGKPRTIGAVEEAILLHHKIDVMNDLSKNTEVALDANADAGDRAEARMTAARLMDQLNDIDEATRKAGTEWGRTGRFRQVLALEDYSLAKMLQRSELAKGRPLTEEEQVKVQQMSTRIADLEKKLAEHEQQADTRREQTKNADADKAIEEMKKPATEADKYSQGILDRIRQGLQSQEDKAWARIRARLGKASAGVDPTVLYDVAVIGANRLFKTGLDFAKWSSEMAKTFSDTLGDTITPHLKEIFEQSKKINDEAIEKGAPKELRAKLKTKPKDDAEARTQIVQTINNRSKAKESLGGQIKKLALNFVSNGITEREALVTAVHDAVKEVLPEATRRDIRDSISGQGIYRELDMDAAKVVLRDLQGQMQQISKIEDLTGKGPTGKPKLPDPTGAQRRTKTAEERVLEQEVNRIKKESGLEQTDPRSLKGAMDAVKARLKNRIEDLQLAISKKEKLPAKGQKLADDPETTQLRRDKDVLQKEYDAMLGVDTPGKESAKEAALTKSIDDLKKQIETGETEKAKEATADTQRVAELKAQRDELLQKKEEIRRTKNPPKTEDERKIDALEKRAAELRKKIDAGDIGPKTGKPTVDTAEVAAAKAEVEKLNDQIAEMRKAAHPPKSEEARRLESLEKRVEEVKVKIAAGDLAGKPKRATVDTQEIAQAKSELAALNEQLSEMRKAANPPRTPEQIRERSLDKRIGDLEKKIAAGDISTKTGKPTVDTAEIAARKVKLEALNKELADLRETANPKLTPDQIALKVYKTRTAKRIADLQDRLARKDFSTKPRKLVPLDAEGFKLKTDAERAKLAFDREAYKDQQTNRGTWEKIIDYVPKLSRAALLSSPLTMAKLFAAALWRIGITPAEELIGSGLNKLPWVSEVAARAPREGAGFNVRAEAKALTDAVMLGGKDALQKLFHGVTDLDTIGGKRDIIPHEVIDVFGNIHGAMKSPVVRAEFARSFEQRARFAITNGLDVTDPMVLISMQVGAYRDAQRAIFMQDSRLVSSVSAMIKRWGDPSKVTGRPTLGGKLAQAGARTLLPIVKIPTNIVAEAFQYGIGSITGSAKLGLAMRRGVETLKPEEADMIMRELKKGSLGGAVMLLGFLAPQMIGGYYQQGQKRKDSDVKSGGVRLYGANIPPMLLHNPAVEMLQVGATVRRVADSKLRKKDRGVQGIPAGVMAAGLGLIQEVPFVNETTQISKVFNPNERTQFFGELARSRTEPQVMQWLAQQGDKRGANLPEALLPWKGEVRQRKPENFKDEMKMGIPGLRKTVPLKKKSPYAAFSGAR